MLLSKRANYVRFESRSHFVATAVNDRDMPVKHLHHQVHRVAEAMFQVVEIFRVAEILRHPLGLQFGLQRYSHLFANELFIVGFFLEFGFVQLRQIEYLNSLRKTQVPMHQLEV